MYSDLAIESRELDPSCTGITETKDNIFGINVSRMEISDKSAAKRLGRAVGRYITLDVGDLSLIDENSVISSLSWELSGFIPEGNSPVLVVGLGNRDITPDAIGPEVASSVFATRHIGKELKENLGLKALTSVAVISPGVLGQTGIESAEIVECAVNKIKPKAVIAVDALTSRGLKHLGRTIQISNSGISPGSGVKNKREELSRETLGVPVIAIGIPTVVNLSSLDEDGSTDMIVTPKEIDLIVKSAAKVIAAAVNSVLHPKIDRETLVGYLS